MRVKVIEGTVNAHWQLPMLVTREINNNLSHPRLLMTGWPFCTSKMWQNLQIKTIRMVAAL